MEKLNVSATRTSDMKKLIFTLLCLVAFPTCVEGRELFPIDWEQIEKTTLAYPDSVKSLVARMSAPTIDRTLSWDERRLAVYGQSVLNENKYNESTKNTTALYKDKKYKEAIASAKEDLEFNPLDASALITCGKSILVLIEQGDSSYQKSDADVFFNRVFRIYNTIATTGDGSKEHPFYVTCVPEEYSFMRYYLDLWDYASQSLVGQCDVFTLGETSEYYKEKTIYFDTSRSLALLVKRLKDNK